MLQTARLRLDPPRDADAPRIVALANDFEIARWLSRLPHPYGPEDARYFLTDVVADEHVWAIRTPEAGLIGVVGLTPSEDGGELELGYWLGRPYWGRGYMTEAAEAVAAHARTALAPARLVAAYHDGNAASARILAKLGFVETGRAARYCRALDAERPLVLMRRAGA